MSKKRRQGSTISEVIVKYMFEQNPVTKASYRSIIFNRLDRIEEFVENFPNINAVIDAVEENKRLNQRVKMLEEVLKKIDAKVEKILDTPIPVCDNNDNK